MFATFVLRGTEYTLTASHLSMEQLGPDRIPFAFAAKGAKDGGQENIWHIEYPSAIFDRATGALYS